MSDISNQFVKDTYNYVLQSDITTGVVYRIGGNVPVNPIFSSGVTFLSSMRYSDGTEQNGYILSTDGFGNATWVTPFSGGGITTLNGITVPSQTFATGISGSDFNIFSTGSTHTFNIPDASSTVRGLVTTGTQYFSGIKIFNDGLSASTITSTVLVGSIVSGDTFLGDGSELDGVISAITWNSSNKELDFFRNNTTPFTVGLTGMTDVYVTGGTYNDDTKTATFTNTSGGTFSVTGFTDVYVTGGTLSGGTLNLNNNSGQTITVSGFTQKISVDVGDSSSSAITITHNLSSRDIQVEVYRNSSPWDTIYCDVERLTINSVVLLFANPPSTNEYRVVIV